MKKLFSVLLVCFAFSFQSFSQEYAAVKLPEPTSKLYFGIGTGLNNYLGLAGVTLEYRVADPITMYGAVGLGSWGSKISVGGRYYGNYPSKWAFGLGYSQASGIENLEMDLPADYVVGYSSTVKVPFKLKSAGTLNFSAMRYWMLGANSKNRFNIELGYAVPVATDPYEINGAYKLTAYGKAFMNTMQPGGLILGLGLSFGL
jgi:hypothetical protein